MARPRRLRLRLPIALAAIAALASSALFLVPGGPPAEAQTSGPARPAPAGGGAAPAQPAAGPPPAAQAPVGQPAAQGGAGQPGQPVPIDRNGVLLLVRSTILALDQANKTGNYTVLRDLGSPAFQAANTAARLSEIFANLRGQNVDLSGVAVLEPQLTVAPVFAANGMMRMAGYFPSVAQQVNFEFLFAPTAGQWRLFGIAVGLGQPGMGVPGGAPPSR